MFIRYVSHEIRNPLNVMMLGLDHLEEIILSRVADQCSHVEIIRDIKTSCKSTLTILNDMVTSEKIRNGFLVLEKRRCNLRDVLYGAIESLRAQVQWCYYDIEFCLIALCVILRPAARESTYCWRFHPSASIL